MSRKRLYLHSRITADRYRIRVFGCDNDAPMCDNESAMCAEDAAMCAKDAAMCAKDATNDAAMCARTRPCAPRTQPCAPRCAKDAAGPRIRPAGGQPEASTRPPVAGNLASNVRARTLSVMIRGGLSDQLLNSKN